MRTYKGGAEYKILNLMWSKLRVQNIGST